MESRKWEALSNVVLNETGKWKIQLRQPVKLSVIMVIQLILLWAIYGVVNIDRLDFGDSLKKDGGLIANMQSHYSTYDNGWSIEPNPEEPIYDSIEWLYGPYIPLRSGTYTLRIKYSCDSDQSFYVIENHNTDYIQGSNGSLWSNSHYISQEFKTTKDIQGLEVVIKYVGIGSLRIDDIQILKSVSRANRIVFVMVVIFAIIDMIIYFQRKGIWQKDKNVFLALGGTIIMASLPLLAHGILGHDLEFHLLRIDGLANELKRGVFPVRMQSLWMEGYGYPVSILYGDLLLYFPAMLRLLGFSVSTSYQIFMFFMNTLTTLIAFACFRRMFGSKKIGALTAFAYVTASYRLMDIYIRAAVGEVCAITFLPLIALAIYNIYMEDISDWKRYRKNALILAAGVSGLLETHVLSCEMAVFILSVFCVVMWKKTFRKNTFCVFLLAVVETILLNLFFLLPFLDYYLTVPLKVTDAMKEEVMHIQGEGAYFVQYFAFNQNPPGVSYQNVCDRMVMTPGFLLIAAFVGAIFLFVNHRGNRKIAISFAFSVFSLWVASNLFPWNRVADSSKIGNLLAQVQFPWRYIGLAIIFLTVLLGFEAIAYLKQNAERASWVLTALTIASICFSFGFLSRYCDYTYTNLPLNTCDLYLYDVEVGEYLPPEYYEGFNLYPETDSAAEVKILSRDGTRMKVYCETGAFETNVVLPVFRYKYYRITDEDGKTIQQSDYSTKKLSFLLPANYSGTISVQFDPPWYWHVAELVSAISLVITIFLCFRKRWKSDQKNTDEINSQDKNVWDAYSPEHNLQKRTCRMERYARINNRTGMRGKRMRRMGRYGRINSRTGMRGKRMRRMGRYGRKNNKMQKIVKRIR